MGLAKLKKPVPRSFLGIDGSSKLMGFGLIVDGKPVKWGVINYAGKDRFERLVDSVVKVEALMKMIGPVDVVVQEQAVGSLNQKTGLYLAQAYGATMKTFIENSNEYIMVNPNEWQAALGVKAKTPAAIKKEMPGKTASFYSEEARRERKRRNIQWVEDTYGIKLPYEFNDAADGIGLSWWGGQQYA